LLLFCKKEVLAFLSNVTFSADDFGLTVGVNEAVERAFREGVLTQASLMVAGPAAADAVRRAKGMPGLKVGLHVVVVDGDSLLGHERLPLITSADGRFGRDQVGLGVRYFFSPAARRELRAEIWAQFEAFGRTGLVLHHADAHKHMHVHPTVGNYLIEVGKAFGLRRVRVPAEPPWVMAACGERVGWGERALYWWTRVLRGQVKRAGMEAGDFVFGIKWSGHMTGERVRRLLERLPEGEVEIYFHPATVRDEALVRLMPDYEHEAEFRALLELG
jgi:hopanoid biosynthesis associated protein HpnK